LIHFLPSIASILKKPVTSYVFGKDLFCYTLKKKQGKLEKILRSRFCLNFKKVEISKLEKFHSAVSLFAISHMHSAIAVE